MHLRLEHYLEAPISGTKYLHQYLLQTPNPNGKCVVAMETGYSFYVKFVHHKRVEDPSF
jgi:hypothetical protein